VPVVLCGDINRGCEMKCYKITNENDQTYGGCQWGEGVTHTADGEGGLCTHHWIHAYSDRYLAVVLNPIHGDYGTGMHLWECEAEIGRDDHGLKFGTTKLTTVKRVPIPRISKAAKVRFAIYCELDVYKDKSSKKWANNWLSGKDRTAEAARAVWAAEAAAWAAARAAWAAAPAAWAAETAAWAAAPAARAAEAAAWAAEVAARAAEVAAWAAWAAEVAARAAEVARAADIDFLALIKKAIKDEKNMVKEK